MNKELRELSHLQLMDKMIETFEETNFVIQRKINNELMQVVLPEGMTMEQVSVLRFLNRNKQGTSSELADYLCVNKSTITSTITRMVNKGLVTREQSQEDRRVTFLALSEEGEALTKQLRAAIKQQLMRYIDIYDIEKAIEYIAATSYLATILKKDL